MQRIVSLLPSATEIVCLLGLRENLVGRSHECDFPLDVASVPVMTYSSIGVTGDDGQVNPHLTSAQIDAAVSSQLREGLSLYGLHRAALAQAQPDLILTQELCDVCAVSYSTVRAAVRDLSGKWPQATQVVSLEPTHIEGIFETILTVGELTDRVAIAQHKVAVLRERVAALKVRAEQLTARPRVAALEWLDPPFAPGHWVPEQIVLAGGECVMGRTGKPSVRTTWAEVERANPDVIVAMPCGYDQAGSQHELALAQQNFSLLRHTPCLSVNATAYFSRPGPRVVEGADLLAGQLSAIKCNSNSQSEIFRTVTPS